MQERKSDSILWWLAAVLVVAGFAYTWSNHFPGAFHLDDAGVITQNQSIRGVHGIPRFFTNPRTFSARTREAAFRPVLTAWFALEYRFSESADPLVFNTLSFFWFVVAVSILYGLFSMIPGIPSLAALLAAALCGLHPFTAETVNDPARAGRYFAAIGIAFGLMVWMFWPRRLPRQLPIVLRGVPVSRWDVFLRRVHPPLSRAYKAVRATPLLYLVPVIPAMLADPAAAAFAPLLLVFIVLFEPAMRPARAAPALMVCAACWIFQTAFAWGLSAPGRVPALSWFAAQPWVAMRVVFLFLNPAGLTADTGIAVSIFQTLAGLVGVALLGALAVFTARRTEWRVVSFGLWWFLIVFAVEGLAPQHRVDVASRMFLPCIGLALAASGALWILASRVAQSTGGAARRYFAAAAVAIVVLVACGWKTHERNSVWQTEDRLWTDAVLKNQDDGRAWMNLGNVKLLEDDITGYDDLLKAQTLLPRDAAVQISLARAAQKLNRESDIEKHYLQAISLGGDEPSGYSEYGQWLLARRRGPEALAMSKRATDIDPFDLAALHILMESYSSRFEWGRLRELAAATKKAHPDDPVTDRMFNIAQSAFRELETAEKEAAASPSAENYMALSVVYFKYGRLPESEKAAAEARRRSPGLPTPVANLATIYFAMGRIDDSIAAWREVIRLNPAFPSARNNLDYELGLQSSRQKAP